MSPKPSSGTCNGDSGSAALLPLAAGAEGDGGPIVVGILSSNTMPCAGSNGMFVNPAAFAAFLQRASKDLGSPLEVVAPSSHDAAAT